MGRIIKVRGTGVAYARPDRVRFSGTLSGRCGAYAEALEASDKAVRSLKKAVGEAGFDMDDLRTSGMSVRAVYAEKERKGTKTKVFDCFEYSYEVTMAADLCDDCIGRLMDALTGCEGAPAFDVFYEVSDPSVPQSEARRPTRLCRNRRPEGSQWRTLGVRRSRSRRPQAYPSGGSSR